MLENSDVLPDRLDTLVNAISNAFSVELDRELPMGIKWDYIDDSEDELHDYYNIIVFPACVEQVGGSQDGKRFTPKFAFRLSNIISLFDDIEDLVWCTLSHGPENKPEPANHLTILGTVEPYQVAVHILNEAPSESEAGIFIDQSGHCRTNHKVTEYLDEDED